MMLAKKTTPAADTAVAQSSCERLSDVEQLKSNYRFQKSSYYLTDC
jgi:hypothetical protein